MSLENICGALIIICLVLGLLTFIVMTIFKKHGRVAQVCGAIIAVLGLIVVICVPVALISGHPFMK